MKVMKDKIEMSLPSLNIGGFKIIKQTFKVFIQNFWPIVMIVGLVAIPVEVFKNYYFVAESTEENLTTEMRRDGWVNTIFLSLITPTLIYYLLNKLNHFPITIWESFKFGFRKWGLIVGYGLLHHLIVMAGLVTLVIPGISQVFIIFALRIYISLKQPASESSV
jgi:hypothetical protein